MNAHGTACAYHQTPIGTLVMASLFQYAFTTPARELAESLGAHEQQPETLHLTVDQINRRGLDTLARRSHREDDLAALRTLFTAGFTILLRTH